MIKGTVFLSPEDGTSEEIPGAGAVISVIGKKVGSRKVDTLYATAGSNGVFFMNKLAPGNITIKFSMMGYEDMDGTMTLVPGENKVAANLKPVKYALEAAVKKVAVNPVSVDKDTVIFHASAVKVNKGESAIDILEQMPGVEVGGSGVTVLGESVATVYVDGTQMFGTAPMSALNNLPAEEVVSIKSFQEYANKDPRHKISKNESKQRVLDIATKSKSKGMAMGHLTAGGGYDTDTTYHKFRYTLGGFTSYFSEPLQVMFNFNLNNINDATIKIRGNSFLKANGGGGADLKESTVNFTVNKRWMSSQYRNYQLGSLAGSYSYSDKKAINESMSERVYFPTDEYSSRRSESSSYSMTRDKVHTFGISGSKSLPDGNLEAGASYSMSDNHSLGRSRSYNYQDDLMPQGVASSTANDGETYGIGVHFGANKGFFNKIRLGTSVDFNKGNSETGSTKIDTTTTTITNTVLDIDTGAESHSFSVSPSIRYELSDRSSLSMGYSFNNSFSQHERWAYDVTEPLLPEVDSINTQIRTNDNNTHSTSLAFTTAFGRNDAFIMDAGLKYKSTGLNRSDAFPEEEPIYSRRFNSLKPYFKLNTNRQINDWKFTWTTTSDTPSIEQLRPKLNNTNLYSVSAGNPDLRQSSGHKFSLKYSTVLGREAREALSQSGQDQFMERDRERGRRQERAIESKFATFEVSGNFSFSNDVIVGKKTYFVQETYLPEYGYLMPAQSTFSSYENASGAYSASLNANAGVPVMALMCIFSGSASMGWDRSPSYVNEVLTYTQNFRPTVGLGVRSNFSRTIRFNLNGNGSYVYSENDTNGQTEYFTESIRAGFELNNILKVLYFGGNYTKTFMQGIAYKAVNDNILNLNGGVRFGPRNNYDFSIRVHDLFNKTSGFSTSMKNDYVDNVWSHNFGRYVMFYLNLHFTSKQGRR